MSAMARQKLHTLVDMVEDVELELLYNLMLRFIPVVDPLPDEVESHRIAMEEANQGETVAHDDIDWG